MSNDYICVSQQIFIKVWHLISTKGQMFYLRQYLKFNIRVDSKWPPHFPYKGWFYQLVLDYSWSKQLQ